MNTVTFDFSGEIPFEVTTIDLSTGDKPIYIGFPFSGYPKVVSGNVSQTVNSLVIDSNIFGDIWQKRNRDNIEAMINCVKRYGLNFSTIFAASELYLGYSNPDQAMDEFNQSLLDDYQCGYPKEALENVKGLIRSHTNNIQSNVDIVKAYLVIVKNIFLTPGGVKKHVEILTETVKFNNLPQFGFVMLLSLVLFYARKNQSQFDKKMISKIDKDMQLKSKRSDEEKLLDNMAKDLCMFISATEFLYSFRDRVCDISWLASGDATVGLMMQELEYCWHQASCEMDKGFKESFMSEVRLKETGKCHEALQPLVEKYWSKNLSMPSTSSADLHQKKLNLINYAESIMNNYQWKS